MKSVLMLSLILRSPNTESYQICLISNFQLTTGVEVTENSLKANKSTD